LKKFDLLENEIKFLLTYQSMLLLSIKGIVEFVGRFRETGNKISCLYDDPIYGGNGGRKDVS